MILSRDRWLLLLVGTLCVARSSAEPNAVHFSLPEDLTHLLSEVDDLRPNFDVPAYYALVRYVRGSATPPEAMAGEPLANWTDLADRPSAYRGRAITIRGLIGRNKSHRYHGDHADLGQVWQLELRSIGQPMSMTVICTADVSDLAIGTDIEISGYFLMLRQFQTGSGKKNYGGLMVAQGPTQVLAGAVPDARNEYQPAMMIGSIIVGLLVAVIMIRRRTRGQLRDVRTLRSGRSAPVNLANDLEQWSHDEQYERQS